MVRANPLRLQKFARPEIWPRPAAATSGLMTRAEIVPTDARGPSWTCAICT